MLPLFPYQTPKIGHNTKCRSVELEYMPSKTQWVVILFAALYGASQQTNPYAALGSATGFFLLFLFIAGAYNGTVTAKFNRLRTKIAG